MVQNANEYEEADEPEESEEAEEKEIGENKNAMKHKQQNGALIVLLLGFLGSLGLFLFRPEPVCLPYQTLP